MSPALRSARPIVGIVGALERPLPGQCAIAGRTLVISGWAFGDRPIAAVEIAFDGCPNVLAQRALLRPDVEQAYPEHPDAAHSGWLGLLDLRETKPGRRAFTVAAIDSDGARQSWSGQLDVITMAAAVPRRVASRRDVGGDSAARGAADDMSISVIVDSQGDEPPASILRTIASIDAQLHSACDWILRWRGGGPPPVEPATTGSLTDAIERCAGQWVSVVASGEELVPEALSIAALNAVLHPGLDLLYADHINERGREPPADFKPAWSPLRLASNNYIGHPWFASRSAVLAVLSQASDSPHPLGCAEANLLRGIGGRAPLVGHVGMTLLARRGPDEVDRFPDESPALVRPSISVIVPTRLSRRDVVERCLHGLARTALDYGPLRILLVVNNVIDRPAVLEAARAFADLGAETFEFEGDFNWAEINNLAAARCDSDYLLFLNDDVEPIDTGWLASMVALAARDDVGAVGALLRYPNGRIQHAGVHLVPRGEVEGRHVFRYCRGDEPEILSALRQDREHTAVTGACLLTARSLFESLGGFDESFALVFNDVDYCLRAAERGWRSAVAAGATLIHHEGLSRGAMPEQDDAVRFARRWKATLAGTDPFYNPQLSSELDDWTPDRDSRPGAIARLSLGGGSRSPMSTDLAWKQWGEQDPYFGVITDPRFRSLNLTEEARKLFFDSGRSHVRHVLTICRKQVVRGEFEPRRVLDFGCGVGRLVIPFAEVVPQVVGVDVSEGMLAEAKANCEALGLINVSLLLSDDALSRVEGTFDLIHSAIVFQHIEVERGREIFRQLLQRLSPLGLGVLHVTYAKQTHADNWGQPEKEPAASVTPPAMPRPRGLRTLLPRIPAKEPESRTLRASPSTEEPAKDPEMQMNSYNVNELLFMVQQTGARRIHLEFTDHGGELGVILYFQRG